MAAGEVARGSVEPAESQRLLGGWTAASRDFTARCALYLVPVQLDDGGAARPTLGAVASIVALVRGELGVRPGDIRVVGFQLFGTLKQKNKIINLVLLPTHTCTNLAYKNRDRTLDNQICVTEMYWYL